MKTADYTVKNINTKDIIVNINGQRDVERRNAQFNKIMREFDPNLVQDISVAFIDGKYQCIDGQMTRKVLIAKNGGKDLNVRCKVYNGLTEMDAAMMFTKQRGVVSPVDKTDIIRVEANYGKKAPMDFIRVTEANGLFISWKRQKGKNAIVAVSTLYDIFQDFDDNEEYASFIRVLKRSWDGDPKSLCRQILSGMAFFYKTYWGKFDEERLIRQMQSVNPMTIIRNAEVDRSSGPRKYAYQILLKYNERATRAALPNSL